MKYIQTYEGTYLDTLNSKSEEYHKYIDKFIIFNYGNQLQFGKFIGFWSKYYTEIQVYDFDDFIGAYNVLNYNNMHLEDFHILKVFDTMKEAAEEYKIIKEIEKYNL